MTIVRVLRLGMGAEWFGVLGVDLKPKNPKTLSTHAQTLIPQKSFRRISELRSRPECRANLFGDFEMCPEKELLP